MLKSKKKERIHYLFLSMDYKKCSKSLKCADNQENAVIVMKAARIGRQEIFEGRGFNFNGSFPHGCQQESVPTALKLLVMMLLKGPNILDQDSVESQACLTIAQTILFNCKKATTKGAVSSTKPRHSLKYEPSLPIYIGLKGAVDLKISTVYCIFFVCLFCSFMSVGCVSIFRICVQVYLEIKPCVFMLLTFISRL